MACVTGADELHGSKSLALAWDKSATASETAPAWGVPTSSADTLLARGVSPGPSSRVFWSGSSMHKGHTVAAILPS